MNINPMVPRVPPQPIKRFKDLYIDCSEEDARSFFATVLNFVRNKRGDKWTVDAAGMKMLTGISFEKGLFCSIILHGDDKQPYADVTIKYDHDEKRIWLCNIVPCLVNELTFDQYNNALDKFKTEIVDKCIGALRCTTTSDSFVGADVMSAETWKRLKSFSDLANRSSLHPYDNQRWHRFVICAFNNDPKLDGDTISKILNLQLGWSAEKSIQLVIRYEDEIALLKEYCGLPL